MLTQADKGKLATVETMNMCIEALLRLSRGYIAREAVKDGSRKASSGMRPPQPQADKGDAS